MPASVTFGILLIVAGVIIAKTAAWGLFQRKVMKQDDGFLTRRAGALFLLAAATVAAGVWVLVARPL